MDDTIDKFLNLPSVNDAIQLTQMKTRFDYVEPPAKREELRKIQKNVIELRGRQIAQEMSNIYSMFKNWVLIKTPNFQSAWELSSWAWIERSATTFLSKNCRFCSLKVRRMVKYWRIAVKMQ